MSKLRSPSGNLAAQRDAEGSKFFDRKIKKAGSGAASSPFSPMNKPRLAQTDAVIGSLPSGANTAGGVIGGLSDKGSYQGMRSGTK